MRKVIIINVKHRQLRMQVTSGLTKWAPSVDLTHLLICPSEDLLASGAKGTKGDGGPVCVPDSGFGGQSRAPMVIPSAPEAKRSSDEQMSRGVRSTDGAHLVRPEVTCMRNWRCLTLMMITFLMVCLCKNDSSGKKKITPITLSAFQFILWNENIENPQTIIQTRSVESQRQRDPKYLWAIRFKPRSTYWASHVLLSVNVHIEE